ncbi:MAG TPA: glutathione binding-like protein [Kofleriaceae bacterium]
MELYFAPLACSLATRMSLYEAGIAATFTRVDLKAHRLPDGRDYAEINPLGQVPVLRTDGGELLFQNAAILQHVAETAAPGLAPADRAGLAQLAQWLSFISTELHTGIFALHFDKASTEPVKAFARDKVASRFGYLERHLTGRDYLLDRFTVADAYLATVLNWTQVTGPNLADWPAVQAFHRRVLARPAVARAFGEELAMYTEEQRQAAK